MILNYSEASYDMLMFFLTWLSKCTCMSSNIFFVLKFMRLIVGVWNTNCVV